MTDLTDAGRQAIAGLAGRYGLSQGAVEAMARAVAQGGGTMAQFNIPELGGGGQWMAGGMTMVGDMFNTGLQNTVQTLCGELSGMMAQTVFFHVPQAFGGGSWWPAELGQPASSGGQNQMRYAFFPGPARLAVDPGDGSPVVLLDTLDHQIGGFSQQQSGMGDPFQGLSFSSQYGQFSVASLPRVGGGGGHGSGAAASGPDPFAAAPVEAPAPAPMQAAGPAPMALQGGADEILGTIERLAKLRDAGALSEEEFAAKKAELLARL